MPGGYSGDGIDRCVLDTSVPDFGGSGNRSPFGECSTCASRSWQAIRCPGLSVASISALGGFAESLVSARTAVCEIRSLMRHRESLVEMSCVHVQHMHKSLDQMNLQIHHVISDITGITGLAIVDAIVTGNTDPKELAKLRDHRIKASVETVTKSLV